MQSLLISMKRGSCRSQNLYGLIDSNFNRTDGRFSGTMLTNVLVILRFLPIRIKAPRISSYANVCDAWISFDEGKSAVSNLFRWKFRDGVPVRHSKVYKSTWRAGRLHGVPVCCQLES